MENDRGIEETWTDWESSGRGPQVGMIIGVAVGVGVLVFILRRIFGSKPSPVEETRDEIIERAASLFGDEPLAAGRELLTAKVLPEMKPVLRMLLREVESSVSQGFKRAERAIDDL